MCSSDLLDGLDFVGVCLDPPVGDQETQQLAGWDPEHGLVGVELEVDPTEVVEGLVQVLEEGVLLPGLDHDVVDVRFNIAAQLRPKACLHHPLEGGSGVPEAERHLVLDRHHGLVISGEGI